MPPSLRDPIRIRTILPIFFLLGLAIYWPSLAGTPVWDDTFLIGVNPFFRSPVFLLEVFRHPLFPDSGYFRPVQNWSYLLDYLIHGGHPVGYHLTNIALHAVAATTVLFFTLRILRDLAPSPDRHLQNAAAAAALLWLVHPAFAATTAYISGRADPLVVSLALGAWLLYRKSGNRPAMLAASGLAWFLALCSRESGLVILLLFVAYEGWRVGFRPWKSAVLPTLVAAPAAGLFLVLRALSGAANGVGLPNETPATERLVRSCAALAEYAILLVFPARLTMERQLLEPGKSLVPLVILGVLALFLLLAGMLLRRPGRQLRVVGASWFVVALIPISPLFVAGSAEMADHWLYIPAIGFLLLLVGCVVSLPRRAVAWVPAAAALFILGFSARTFVRAKDWTGGKRFFEETMSHGKLSTRTVANLASIYAKEGDRASAGRLLRQALSEHPDDILLRSFAGSHELQFGDMDKAFELLDLPEAQWERLSRVHPHFPTALVNRAGIFARRGRRDEAISLLQRAGKVWRENWQLTVALAGHFQAAGRKSEATALVEDFVAKNWWNQTAALTLAYAYADEGRFDEAAAVAKNARKLDIRSSNADRVLAAVYAGQGRYADAIELQSSVIAQSGGKHRDDFERLAQIFASAGHPKQADAVMKAAPAL